MADRLKAVLPADRFLKAKDFFVFELDDGVALVAMKVVVRRIAVIVFERGPVGEPKFAKQAGLDEEPKGSIHRGSAYASARVVKVADKFLGVEVLMRIEHVTDQEPPRLGELLAANLEKLAEFFFRSFRNRHRRQRLGVGHGGLPRKDHGISQWWSGFCVEIRRIILDCSLRRRPNPPICRKIVSPRREGSDQGSGVKGMLGPFSPGGGGAASENLTPSMVVELGECVEGRAFETVGEVAETGARI